jgi:murein DD-endopeptidase MepM/ murein hydrolase activator NlpD
MFFVAIVFLHNRFVETDYEAALRAENKVLASYKPVLEKELSAIESTLTTLQTEEQSLYTKFFNAPPASAESITPSLSKEQVLRANASSLHSLIDVLNERSNDLYHRSSRTNHALAERMIIPKSEIERLSKIPSIQPIDNPFMTNLASGFGQRINPFHKGSYFHPGIDFVAPRGTSVYAAGPGKVLSVSKSDLQAGYGNQIVIDHGAGFTTRYAHLEEIKVKSGQTVTQGMVIGTVGNSGGSIAPHLHYEVMKDGDHVDPALYFMEGLTSKEHQHLVELSKKQNQSLD